jgi:uncharacterized membrane protein YdjX (TVP38/TMEM64 family)
VSNVDHGFNIYAVLASLLLAVLLFYVGRQFPTIEHVLRSAGYAGTFIIGILYVYSFTSLPATAMLIIVAKSQNVWMAGTVASLGAVVGDLVLFGLFRSATRAADGRARRHRQHEGWLQAIERAIPPAWQGFVIGAVVIILLVLPLPNEFSDFLLARTRKVKASVVPVISYVLNGVGLYTIVWLAHFG